MNISEMLVSRLYKSPAVGANRMMGRRVAKGSAFLSVGPFADTRKTTYIQVFREAGVPMAVGIGQDLESASGFWVPSLMFRRDLGSKRGSDIFGLRHGTAIRQSELRCPGLEEQCT